MRFSFTGEQIEIIITRRQFPDDTASRVLGSLFRSRHPRECTPLLPRSPRNTPIRVYKAGLCFL